LEKLLIQTNFELYQTTMNSPVVIKLGGSFLFKHHDPNIEKIQEMINTLQNLPNQKLIIVIGGGIIAKQYVTAGLQLKLNPGVNDRLGITVSRLNAQLFIEALMNIIPSIYTQVPTTLDEIRQASNTHRIVVTGGLQPGQSTTAVATLIAEYCQASRILYCTNVAGVYDSNPDENPEAKLLSQVTLKQLESVKGKQIPGQYDLMDTMSLTVLSRSHIPARIMQGEGELIQRTLLNPGAQIGTKIVY